MATDIPVRMCYSFYRMEYKSLFAIFSSLRCNKDSMSVCASLGESK